MAIALRTQIAAYARGRRMLAGDRVRFAADLTLSLGGVTDVLIRGATPAGSDALTQLRQPQVGVRPYRHRTRAAKAAVLVGGGGILVAAGRGALVGWI